MQHGNRESRQCSRCHHVLVDEDEVGWYYQTPATDPLAPFSGFTFMDRVHECDGRPHDVIIQRNPLDTWDF